MEKQQRPWTFPSMAATTRQGISERDPRKHRSKALSAGAATRHKGTAAPCAPGLHPPMSSSWESLTSPAAYRSPAFIALVAVLCVAVVLLLHHCVLVTCCRGGGGRRRRRRQGAAAEEGDEEEDEESGASVEATSRTHLVVASPAVVCRYRKEEKKWSESTCPVCLADFDDGEPVRVLPECLHYFHGECIDTWLRGGSTSCPMCRAETTPTPTATPSPGAMHHHQHRLHRLDLSVSVSLEEILVRT